MNKREEGKRNKIKSKAGIVKIKTPANEVSFLVSALSVSAVCFSRTEKENKNKNKNITLTKRTRSNTENETREHERNNIKIK